MELLSLHFIKEFLRGAAWVAFARFLAIGVSLVSSIILVRALGAEELGKYATVYAVITLAIIPLVSGLPNLIIREVSAAISSDTPNRVWQMFKWSNRVALGLGAIAFLCLLGASIYLVRIEWYGAKTLMAALPLVFTFSVIGVWSGFLNGFKRFFLAMFFNDVLRPSLLIILVLIGIGLGKDITAERAVLLQIVASLIALSCLAFALWRVFPNSSSNNTAQIETRALWLSLLPTTLFVGLTTFNQSTDLLMLGVLRSPEEVAYYRVAMSIAVFAQIANVIARTASNPQIAAFQATKNTQDLERIARVSSRIAFAGALLAFLFILVAGRPILAMLYGAEFTLSYAPLVILLAGHVVTNFFGLVGPIALMAGLEKKIVFGLIASTLANIVLNLLLIPLFGTQGAALSTACSATIAAILYWQVVKQHLHFDCSLLSFLKPSKQG